VIDDAYNANPASVGAALEVLAATPGPRVFVFGGMRELGDESEALHAEVGRAAGFCDAGVFVGAEAGAAAPEAQRAGMKQVLRCAEVDEAALFLREYLKPGDGVLLKGARAAALERVAMTLGVVPEGYGEGRL
jgi:UDP-N-acetylmuramoyl-tripeptide--D-alanyl-D-alanine ligase